MVTEILDHDAHVGNMMVNTVLACLKDQPQVDWQALRSLLLVADCGPHFRSKENLAHFCVILPRILSVPVEICYLGEQHGKSGVDRCFGWCNAWITEYIRRHPIFGLDDLVTCFQQGAATMLKDDPASPPVLVQTFAAGTHRPTKRTFVESDELKISRTYSLVGTPSPYASSGVALRNKVFSDMSTGDAFTWSLTETSSPEAVAWRVGYYDKPRTWEKHGVELGKDNSITRRFKSQKTKKVTNMPARRPTFLEACTSKALSLRRAAAKKRRKNHRLRNPPAEDAGTSSSTSSSSTSDSESCESSDDV